MVEAEKAKTEPHDEVPKSGESLMMKRVMLKPQKEVHEPVQGRHLFKTMCKAKSKCCKLIIDNGSTGNVVSKEIVYKLGLKKIPHPTPYRASWIHKGHQVWSSELGHTVTKFYAM